MTFTDHHRHSDSGGQYRDGTCDTTRTIHFGRPTPDQCEAFTRVLQGHVRILPVFFPFSAQCELRNVLILVQIAIDSAIFPEGTSGKQLDVLARKALWKDGLNYGVCCSPPLLDRLSLTILLQHGTGHGFGSFLTVHEGPQSFASEVRLVPGHVLTNEPGFCK